MPDLMRALMQSIGHQSRLQHKKGEHGKAAGWAMIGFGIFLLPIPIVGIPLIGAGIWMLNS